MIFRTGSDRGAVAYTSQANRTRVSSGREPRPSLRLFGPHQSSMICIHASPKAPAIFLVGFEPNKAGVNAPYVSLSKGSRAPPRPALHRSHRRLGSGVRGPGPVHWIPHLPGGLRLPDGWFNTYMLHWLDVFIEFLHVLFKLGHEGKYEEGCFSFVKEILCYYILFVVECVFCVF